MRVFAEILVFPVLAVIILLAAFLRFTSASSSEAVGAGGDALVTLEASNAQIQTLVENWERPAISEVLEITPPHSAIMEAAPTAPVIPSATPELPIAPSLHANVSQPSPAPPVLDTTPPPRVPEVIEVQQATDAQRRPQPRPLAQEQQQSPRRQPTAQAQQEERASGDQGNIAAGRNDTADAATVSESEIRDRRTAWGAQIRGRIERRKRSPRGNATGTVRLRITLQASGQLTEVSVANSSGHTLLDDAALRAVRSVRRFPAAPAGVTGQQTFTIPLRFQ